MALAERIAQIESDSRYGEAAKPAIPEVPSSALHADWVHDWGLSVKSVLNRKAIIENKRLIGRPAADIARQLGIPALESGVMSQADIYAFTVMGLFPKRFVQCVGLASISPYLAKIIDGEGVRGLIQQFPVADLRIALACRTLADEEQPGIEKERLSIIVSDGGPKSLLYWAESLPPSVRGRIKLMMPKSVSSPHSELLKRSLNHNPGMFIRRVAELLSPLGSREKSDNAGSR